MLENTQARTIGAALGTARVGDRGHAGAAYRLYLNDYGIPGGFVGGQVFRFSGFASDEGSLGGVKPADAHVAIVTYWRSFEEHERSHADKVFKERFAALAAMCTETAELGYDMLWQGGPED